MIALLRMEGISKRFNRVHANDNVTFEAEAGEIHALLGENGAGKTTLMNILFGLYRPEEGEIYFNGIRSDIRSPQDAIRLGIGMVHQQFMLFQPFTVAENVLLGLQSKRGLFLEIHETSERIRELSDRYGLKIDPGASISQLSVGAQQRVEIIKALSQGAHLLILDEPTSVLTPSETEEFFVTLRTMANEGHTVIFITHKLKEVMSICDRCTVLRNGRVVGTVRICETTEAELAQMMVGREVVFRVNKKPVDRGKVILDVSDLTVKGDGGQIDVRDLRLRVHAGEILGIAGVDGNGQTELAETIIGIRRAESGCVTINGQDVTTASPKEIIDQKVTHIPEDRVLMGLIPKFTVAENLILDSYDRQPFCRNPTKKDKPGWLLVAEAIVSHAKRTISEYRIMAPGPHAKAHTLSGGNLQKVVLARALYHAPRLLIAVHPTRGLDIGASEFIRNRLLEVREDGCAILLISADLDEVLQLSDRVAVLFEGQLMGILSADAIDMVELGQMMAGANKASL